MLARSKAGKRHYTSHQVDMKMFKHLTSRKEEERKEEDEDELFLKSCVAQSKAIKARCEAQCKNEDDDGTLRRRVCCNTNANASASNAI